MSTSSLRCKLRAALNYWKPDPGEKTATSERWGWRRFAAKRRRKPERALTTLRKVVADAVVLKGVRGKATEVAETLLVRLTEQAVRGS